MPLKLQCVILFPEICKRHQRCHTRVSGTTRPNILYGLSEPSCFGHFPSRERRSLQQDLRFMLHRHPQQHGSGRISD
ncbi:hypothetical protein GDO78_020693 [Eleutherodactylus coqui]|uniref:Uncharacterized protein n=1 Tax=Eleutherodactylus coqui TaxID=57060 RepID=A0A8J6BI30_ELECQ|nr:hypothetical protein GDO78_020693 [Eleutherodactylus coqui]